MNGVSRRLLLALLDVILISVAYTAAFWLRVDSERLLEHLSAIQATLPILIAITLYVHLRLGLFNAILRYASLETAVAVVKAVAISVPISVLIFFLVFRLEGVPRSVFVIYAMAILILVGGSRLAVRWWLTGAGKSKSGKKIVIYGAGDAGALVLRSLRDSAVHQEQPVGFLDDHPEKRGRDVLGLKVLGGLEALGDAVTRFGAEEIWICVASLPGEKVRAIFSAAATTGVAVKVMPRSNGTLDGTDPLGFQPVKVEDLLRRPPRMLDRARMKEWIRDKRVLVTGAGGSIGSELCRQVAGLDPEKLILCDASELNLFNIDRELRARHPSLLSKPYLVNVRSADKVRAMFRAEYPSIVFHAAAYKHVPLVEENPCEGLLNNVGGTLIAAEIAREEGAQDFVFISTDKAVRPSSVMGATKRLGEIVCRGLNQEGPTKFMAVRFGNVLGSSGSVVQIFQEQIRKGGPVTVTHPEMTRYFMLISEAVELVIQAGSLRRGGEVFLLDMGAPVRILDLAESMIRLMGRAPKTEVHIEITGPRPGEKIHEEMLVGAGSGETEFPDLRLDSDTALAMGWPELRRHLKTLLQCAESGSQVEALRVMSGLLPDWKAADLPRSGAVAVGAS